MQCVVRDEKKTLNLSISPKIGVARKPEDGKPIRKIVSRQSTGSETSSLIILFKPGYHITRK